MIAFHFLELLFDKKQYEIFATNIFKEFYMCIEDETDSFLIWFYAEGGSEIAETPLTVTYIDFCRNKPHCQGALKEKIINNLFSERKIKKDLIKKEELNDYKFSEKIRIQGLNELDIYINKFNSVDWLNDKPFILDELMTLKESIYRVPDNKVQFTEIDKLGVDKDHWKKLIKPELQNHLADIENMIESKIYIWKDRKQLIECAAFCQLLYDRKYFVKGSTNRATVNSFALSKYKVDIKDQLDTTRKPSREKHKILLSKYFK